MSFQKIYVIIRCYFHYQLIRIILCFLNYPHNNIHFLIVDTKNERDEVLNFTNKNNIMTRPIWTLMNDLPEFKKCQKDALVNSIFFQSRGISLPSSVP